MNFLESLAQARLYRTKVWEQVAKEIVAQYQGRPSIFSKSTNITGRTVRLKMEEWTISLEEYRTAGDGTESVRMRAPYQDKNGFRFAISRKNMLSEIGKLFGMQDVKIGDAAFDDEFIIKSNDEEKVRTFFDSPRLRELAQAQPYVSFEIRESERPETIAGSGSAATLSA